MNVTTIFNLNRIDLGHKSPTIIAHGLRELNSVTYLAKDLPSNTGRVEGTARVADEGTDKEGARDERERQKTGLGVPREINARSPTVSTGNCIITGQSGIVKSI